MSDKEPEQEVDEINLGDTVMDTITGFAGLCIGKAEYMFGVPKVLIQPFEVDENNEPPKAIWLPTSRCGKAIQMEKTKVGFARAEGTSDEQKG